MFRSHRSAAGLIAVLTIAALLPGLAALDAALFEPLWILLPDPTPVVIDLPDVKFTEQLDSLHSPLPSRGPPDLLA